MNRSAALVGSVPSARLDGRNGVLSGSQALEGTRQARAAIGRGDRPRDELVGAMRGLREVMSWTCGGVRMNSRSAVSSRQTDRVQ
jgi:hypothetical protein